MAVHKVERRKAPAAGRVRILHFRFAKNPFGLFAGFVLPKTKYARSDDVRIAYQISGDGPFDVVWAPGTMSHLDLDWEIPQRALFFERFSKFCRLIRFDKRGTGLSDRPAMIQDNWPSFEYITGPGAGVGKDADPAYIASISRYMRAAASQSAVYAYEQMNGQIDTRPILPSIQAPTLVMNRTGDPCAHVEAARDMASRIPGAKFKEYPGDSHSMMLDDMETVLSDIQEFITGERPIDSSDRILATVLFLDIASSTERAAELGDTPWRNVLNSYYAIVRKELARFRGKETNTTGDGFLATFDGPARAVRCALAIAVAVRQLGIEIRAGVHTGECELMGDNVGGIAVHTGARIMAKAEPGGVLVSGTVKDLVSGSGIDFQDCGVHQLRGIPVEWKLFAARS